MHPDAVGFNEAMRNAHWLPLLLKAIRRLRTGFDGIIFTWRDHVTAAPIRQWT
jgi:hypothetical protein